MNDTEENEEWSFVGPETEEPSDGIPRLSQSIAKVLLDESPAHAYAQHRMLGGKPRRATKAMDFGTVCHSLVLDQQHRFVEVSEFSDWRKKAAKELREELRGKGLIPLFSRDYDSASRLAERVAKQLGIAGVRLSGTSEKRLEWESNGVACEGTPDHVILSDESALILDLKIWDSAHPDKIRKAMATNGSAIQWAAYTNAIETLHPKLAGRVNLLFAVVESSGENYLTLAELSGDKRALGQAKWERAQELWQHCLSNDDWPAYTKPGQIVTIHPMPWEMAQEMEEQ